MREFISSITDENYLVYDYYENGKFISQLEVQFNNGKFNGKIFEIIEDGSEDLEYGELFECVKERAIEDYNKQ